MELSNHAQLRSRQRSIPFDIIEFLFRYGDPIEQPGRALGYRLNNDLAVSMIHDLKKMIGLVEKARKKVVITNEPGSQVITVINQK
jgi:hypothetical protein